MIGQPRTVQLLNAVSATGAGAIQTFDTDGVGGKYGIVQAEITGTATVQIQGRLSATAPWVTVAEFTASGANEILMMPEMRGNVSARTSGTISLWARGQV